MGNEVVGAEGVGFEVDAGRGDDGVVAAADEGDVDVLGGLVGGRMSVRGEFDDG